MTGPKRRAGEIAEYLLPGGVREGREWVAGSVQGERGKSLKVCVLGAKVGVWQDFAAGTGGDLLDLWMAAKGRTLPEALDEVRAWLGIEKQRFERQERKTYSRPAKPACTAPKSAVLAYLTTERFVNAAAMAAFKVGEKDRPSSSRHCCPTVNWRSSSISASTGTKPERKSPALRGRTGSLRVAGFSRQAGRHLRQHDHRRRNRRVVGLGLRLPGPVIGPLRPGGLKAARHILERAARGEKPRGEIIGDLIPEQFAQMNAARTSRGMPTLSSPEVRYDGRHHHASRAKDGDNIDEMLTQIERGLDESAKVAMQQRGPALVNPTPRVNPRGETVRDQAVIEGGAPRPTWLYSAYGKEVASRRPRVHLVLPPQAGRRSRRRRRPLGLPALLRPVRREAGPFYHLFPRRQAPMRLWTVGEADDIRSLLLREMARQAAAGVAPVNTAGAVANGAPVYAAATGKVDDAVVAGELISGMWFAATTGVAGTAAAQLNFPFIV